jgi:G3E family GTPase
MGNNSRWNSQQEHSTTMSQQARIPVLVIGGYLGAGKTTLINRMLSDATQRIAVVVNDFGSVNIDASLIRERHNDTIELTNGCICCAVGESLADVLFTILERSELPEVVIIEASGVANPAAVAAFAHIEGFHHLGNVVLVDATHALNTSDDPLVGRTFALQVEAAHLLAITKTDEANEPIVEQVHDLVSSLAPTTPLVLTTSATLSSLIMNLAPHAGSAITDTHTEFSTTTLSHVSAQDEKQLLAFLQNFPSSVVRAKGVVELANGDRRLVQKVGSTISISPTELPPTGIVLISLK